MEKNSAAPKSQPGINQLAAPYLHKNLTVHLLCIFVLSLLLLIPKLFFDFVLDDRQYLQNQAIRSIFSSWAPEQMLVPPLLVCSATEVQMTDNEGHVSLVERAVLRPAQQVKIDIKLEGQERSRGIYSATLYRAKVSMQGSFDLTELSRDLNESGSKLHSLDLNKLFIYFGLSEISGLEEVEELTVHGMPLKTRPGQLKFQNFGSFMAALPEELAAAAAAAADPDAYITGSTLKNIDFSCTYTVRGSLTLQLPALGGDFELSLSGTDLSPSFKGRFLPGSRSLQDEDFTASYTVSSLATGHGSVFLQDLPEFEDDITLDIQEKAQHYAFIERLSKYALLVIAMTFLCVLAFELASGVLVSLVQYAVSGAALIIFYLLLLSLSEHLSFELSYALSALVLSSMTALYLKAVFQSWHKGALMLLEMLGLYLVLYTIVNAENYALLLGTALLIIMLAVIMYLTRTLNRR